MRRRAGVPGPTGECSTGRSCAAAAPVANPPSRSTGELVTVEANLGAHDDAELAIDNGADGVGLFRIEQLYLARALPPSEDELFEELRALRAAAREARHDPAPRRRWRQARAVPAVPRRAQPSLGRRAACACCSSIRSWCGSGERPAAGVLPLLRGTYPVYRPRALRCGRDRRDG